MRVFKLLCLSILVTILAIPALAQSGRRPTRPSGENPTTRSGNAGTPGNSANPSNGVCDNRSFAGEELSSNTRNSSTSQASSKSDDPNSEAILKIDTTLVTIPVTVLDREGRFVPSLSRCDFHIFEDEIKQEIATFNDVESPFHVVLLIDTSNSTAFKIDQIQSAAVAFVRQLRKDDKVMVVSFDSTYHVQTEFTSDQELLRQAIYQTRNGGSTALYDAVDWVINQRLLRVEGRKAIVLFTDGVDTSSRRASARSNISLVEESDVLVYPVQYDTEGQMTRGRGGYPNGRPQGPIWGSPFPGGRRRFPLNFMVEPQIVIGRQGNAGDYKAAGIYLEDLALHSGGRRQSGNSIEEVTRAFTSIAEELRHQYSIGYYPSNTAQDGSLRKIRVRVSQTGWIVRGKESYRAGANGKPATLTNDRPTLKRSSP